MSDTIEFFTEKEMAELTTNLMSKKEIHNFYSNSSNYLELMDKLIDKLLKILIQNANHYDKKTNKARTFGVQLVYRLRDYLLQYNELFIINRYNRVTGEVKTAVIEDTDLLAHLTFNKKAQQINYKLVNIDWNIIDENQDILPTTTLQQILEYLEWKDIDYTSPSQEEYYLKENGKQLATAYKKYRKDLRVTILFHGGQSHIKTPYYNLNETEKLILDKLKYINRGQVTEWAYKRWEEKREQFEKELKRPYDPLYNLMKGNMADNIKGIARGDNILTYQGVSRSVQNKIASNRRIMYLTDLIKTLEQLQKYIHEYNINLDKDSLEKNLKQIFTEELPDINKGMTNEVKELMSDRFLKSINSRNKI